MKIVLQHLTKKFPGRGRKSREEVIAVKDFTFEIPDGALVGLLGPSGCGKSTTLNLISGLEKPTEGKIFFGEDEVTDVPAERRGIGLVFQNYALYPHLTVKQNILFPLENLKGKDRPTKTQMVERACEAARLVQIEELLDRKPGELSGGQQQRVAIARALVKKPSVLLLDEPLSNLDARLRLQTREEIRRIQRETKITTVFVTHDQEEAMSISDLIVVMKDGVVQQIGKPQEVYDSPANLFVARFLGTPPINVFEGQLRQDGLYIGEERVLSIKKKNSADNSAEKSSMEKGNIEKRQETEKTGKTALAGKTTDTKCQNLPNAWAAQDVYVGIRPEGFIVRENLPEPAKESFTCELKGVEVMGRDISVLSSHKASLNATVRSVIGAEQQVNTASPVVRFELNPRKVLLFDRETEERIWFETAREESGEENRKEKKQSEKNQREKNQKEKNQREEK